MITIKNKGYYKAVASVDDEYTLDPTDNNGNLLERVFIDVDATASTVSIILPEIANLPANWNTEITVLVTAGVNAVTIARAGTDTIGTSTDVAITGVGANVLLTIVGASAWSGVVTS